MKKLQMPKLSAEAHQLADQARDTAARTGARGKKITPLAQSLAWRARWVDVQEGRPEQAERWLQALAVLGAPGAVAAAVIAEDPAAVPSDVLAIASTLVPQVQAVAA